MTFFLVFLFISVIGAFIFWRKNDKKKYENPVYLSNLQQIDRFFSSIDCINDYITWVHRDQLKSEYQLTANYFKNKTTYYKHEEKVKKFNAVFQSFEQYVNERNLEYVSSQKALLKDFFNDIEGKQLDDQQQTALITDEYSNLIIAGAGSGKTLTILGKVKYLIEHKNIDAEDILLLSFTQKTVEELNERLQNMGLMVKATTFHKLGYKIIKKFADKAPAVSNANTLGNVIQSFLDNDIYNYPEALDAYVKYVSCYMNIPEENEAYSSLGNKLDTEKGIDFQTLKSKFHDMPLNKVSIANLDTIQGEKVKSVEELIIANFLFINGIEYEYEKPYPYGDVPYRPDFYLKDYDIYLEHFGVDENNRAKWLKPFNEKKYVEEMEIKRSTHKKFNTKLLETYSYYNRDKILFDKLQEALLAEKVVFKPKDTKEIYSKVTQNDKNYGKEITKLLETFINLSKSRKLEVSSIRELFTNREKTKNKYNLERQHLFLQFALPILKKYNATLHQLNEIDFNDMINKATELIHTQQPKIKYKYIIIDEYQDISYSRFNLIKEIRDLSSARLICVGDDWQSIYRFAGSDISLFSNFENFVGQSQQLLIEQTYRNSQALIDITSSYIQKNKKQIPKKPKSKKEPLVNPIKLVAYSSNNVEEVFIHEIQRLVNEYGNKSILVLGRHSFDINEFIKLSPSSKIKYIERSDKLEIQGYEKLDIKYITVHKSKGLEADNVIILNLKNHLLGFPNKMTDDPLISLLLSDYENFRYAEERRLFYVALTRTKNEVVLLLPSDASLFAEELIADNKFLYSSSNDTVSKTHCPYCQTGHLIVKSNSKNHNQFLGCSNFPICDQAFNDLEILENTVLCPNCESGFMVKRTGKFGDFLGCTNFPKCERTIDLK